MTNQDIEKAENIIISYPEDIVSYRNVFAKDVLNVCELNAIAKALHEARLEGREEAAEASDKCAEAVSLLEFCDPHDRGLIRSTCRQVSVAIRSL